jgi:hypothetical protein
VEHAGGTPVAASDIGGVDAFGADEIGAVLLHQQAEGMGWASRMTG